MAECAFATPWYAGSGRVSAVAAATCEYWWAAPWLERGRAEAKNVTLLLFLALFLALPATTQDSRELVGSTKRLVANPTIGYSFVSVLSYPKIGSHRNKNQEVNREKRGSGSGVE